MVNINIEISDELHKKIKLKSVLKEKTLKDYITEKLSDYIKDGKY